VDEKPGSNFQVSDYTFVFQGTDEATQSNGDIKAIATFAVSRNGRSLGTISPGRTQFAVQGQSRLDAAVMSEPLRDIFVVWEGNQEDQLSVNVKINPLIWFAWGGFALLMLGSSLAAWPKYRPELVAVPADKGISRAKAAKR